MDDDDDDDASSSTSSKKLLSSSDSDTNSVDKRASTRDDAESLHSSSSSSKDDSDHIVSRPARKRARTSSPGVASEKRRMKQARPKVDKDESGKRSGDVHRESLDWDELAESSWAGTDCLFGAMPIHSICSLVGWATHYTRSGDGPGSSLRPVEGSRDSSMGASRQKPESLNPLLYLPNTPLPPSCLKFLSQAATDKVRTLMQDDLRKSLGRCSSDRQHLLGHSDSSDDEKGTNRKQAKTNRKQQRQPWQQNKWTYDSNDETYQLFKSFKRTKNVQATEPAPCDDSQSASDEEEKVCRMNVDLFQSFDQSALVALGMILEEALTASFLPLAKLHVARCRKLEQQHQDHQKIEQKGKDPSKAISETASAEKKCERENLTEALYTGTASNLKRERYGDADPFTQWTLPPAEALMKLVRDDSLPNPEQSEGIEIGLGGLPSAYPATAVNCRLMSKDAAITDSVLDGLSAFPEFTKSQREQRALLLWCKTHGLDPSFVRDNMDLYGLFLPCAPPTKPRPLYQYPDQTVEEERVQQGG